MVRAIRRGSLARLAAGLVALALGGAPRLAVLAAPGASHHCQCARHAPGEACACRQCRAAAAEASRAELEKLPPCHREAARQAAEAERDPPRPPGPCLEGACGTPEHQVSLAGLDPFTLPGAPAPPPVPVADREPVAAAAARQVPHLPETPPPRS